MQHPFRSDFLHAALKTEALLLTPQLTLARNNEAVVEGCAGILRYDDSEVVLNCPPLVLTLRGFDLQLEHLLSGDLRVSGTLTDISFAEATSDAVQTTGGDV